jgi:hypothetical protein
MIRTDGIRSLTEFRQNASAHLNRLAAEGTVEVLTVNGQAKGVVMSFLLRGVTPAAAACRR